MTVDVVDTDVWVHDCELRIPFSFGVTTLRDLPHAFVTATVTVDGTTTRGIAADHLVPRWFSKDPDKSPAEDIADLERVVRRACKHGEERDPAASPFAFWQSLYDRQRQWAESTDHPPLVWGLGVALVERAVVDAFCRATETTFHDAVVQNELGIRPGAVYDELEGVDPASEVPATPRSSIAVRHTVGFDDPLVDSDIETGAEPGEGGAVDDALPHTLEDVIDHYDVRHFKIKLHGDPETDAKRVRNVARVVDGAVENPVYTFDANEQYDGVAELRAFWDHTSDDDRQSVRSGVEFVEQPFPREVALDDDTGEALAAWDGPPVIIDESDDTPGALGRALECGYAGTSHKNCKGVFKSIVNACLLERRKEETDREYVISAEDLSTIGPVALPQDLAVVATLGIEHAERNGHHYLSGLEGFPEAVQEAVLERYPDLYRRHADGYPTLTVEDGTIDVSGVTDAPFGVHYRPDRSVFR